MTVVEFVRRIERTKGRRIKVGLVGLGLTNRAVMDRLLPTGCSITVRQEQATRIPDPVCGIFGNGHLCGIDEDVLFLSPSLRREHPCLTEAEGRGVLLTSECEVFFMSSEERREVFCVSGSDGKSTVTAMAASMLSAAAVGNIGIPYSTRERCERYVCELSSFNLQYLAPHSDAAVITNITPNHLNWHSGFDEYLAAKARVLENAKRRVLSADDEVSRGLIRRGEVLFSCALSKEELSALGAARAVHLDGGYICIDGERLMPLSELAHRERHNILNFMAAVGLSLGYASTEDMRRVGREFSALGHRCQSVHRSAHGVDFIDSSIDTSPSRTAATLSGLGRSVFVLLGGRGKGLSLAPLLPVLSRYARGIGIYGECRQEIFDLVKSSSVLSGVPTVVAEKFTDALIPLCDMAGEGDTVILSPAATAYGEFENFERRGECFTDTVRRMYP